MKTKNFPGKKLYRQLRAQARRDGTPEPVVPTEIDDQCVRLGRYKRDPQGHAIASAQIDKAPAAVRAA